MQKLKIKSGFTIIEVIMAMAIFTIIFSLVISLKLCTLKMEAFDEEEYKLDKIAENIKEEILCNTSNEQLEELIQSGRIYLLDENMKEDNLKNNDIVSLFQSTLEKKHSYIVLDISDKNEIMEKISLTMYAQVQGKNEVITTVFYKGNYKWIRDIQL